jgi:hypothetical protein
MTDSYGYGAIPTNLRYIADLLLNSDPSVVFSMSRNVPYKSDATDNGKEYDVVFDFIVVVRSQFTERLYDEDLSDYYNQLYAAAEGTVSLWLGAAIDWYEGVDSETLESRAGETLFYELPSTSGPPHITCFGNVVDKNGRFISLTVTSKSTPRDVYLQFAEFTKLYDRITEIAGGKDFSQFGNKAYRQTTIIGSVAKSTAKLEKAEKPQGAASDKAKPSMPSAPSAPSAKSSVNLNVSESQASLDTQASHTMPEPSGPVVCEKFSDVLALPYDTRFIMPVTSASLSETKKGDKILTFWGQVDGVNELEPDSQRKDGVFVYGNRPGFDTLINKINEVLAPETIRVNEPIFVNPKSFKIIATKKTGKGVWYADVVADVN